MSMFCYQCQETAKNTGCTVKGVCGKNEEVAKLQDLLIYTCKGIAEIVTKANVDVTTIPEINHEVLKSLFITITNANFDDGAIDEQIKKMMALRDELKGQNSASDLNPLMKQRPLMYLEESKCWKRHQQLVFYRLKMKMSDHFGN